MSKKIISQIITIGVVLVFCAYFIFNINDFKILLDIKPIFILLLVAISVAGIAINGIFMKLSMVLFDRYLSIRESIIVSFISSAGNFFAPAGSGLGIRAVYLKRHHKLGYSNYVSIVLCSYIFTFIVSSIFGLLALFMLQASNSPGVQLLAFIFLVLLLSSLSLLFFRIKKGQHKTRIGRKVGAIFFQIHEGWLLLLSHRKVMIQLFGLTIVNTLLTLLTTYILTQAIGAHIGFAAILLYSVLGSLSVFINITPGNLGVKEAIYIILSSVIGLSTAEILSIAVIDRAVIFFVLSILWVIYGKKFYNNISAQEKQGV